MYQIIMHNQVSLDGAVSGFQFDPAAYHRLMNSFNAGMYLVGSNTAKAGIKIFAKSLNRETEKDFKKPEKNLSNNAPYWVIPDSEGKLEGLLHIYRNYEHCRDVIILASEKTPESYLKYLEDRAYTTVIAGAVKVDFGKAFEQLNKIIPFETMITDNTGKLAGILLDHGLIRQISLTVTPVLTDKKNPKLFSQLKLGKRVISLNPKQVEVLENNDIRMVFDVSR